MSYMFVRTGYTSMTTLDLGDKFDTSNVTYMGWMFKDTGCISMTTLNLGTFGVNHLGNVNLTNLFTEHYKALQEVIMKNESVKSWIIDVFDASIKNKSGRRIIKNMFI